MTEKQKLANRRNWRRSWNISRLQSMLKYVRFMREDFKEGHLTPNEYEKLAAIELELQSLIAEWRENSRDLGLNVKTKDRR